MESFCASALQREVLPVPGGPWSSTTLRREVGSVETKATRKIRNSPIISAPPSDSAAKKQSGRGQRNNQSRAAVGRAVSIRVSERTGSSR